jgi:AraC family transcriptional regulator, regulatory protein of adaptative response / DNA-3-methyladenine glycosylase II
MYDDEDLCYRAVSARDARFDGWFVIAVTSTGIYCRPSCPARTPKRSNVRFLPTAAAAQQAGFRACKRCRPDASPGSPEWDLRADVVARAMRLIGDGTIDREGVRGLASRLGYSERQVERLVTAELGAGPLALARAQRAQTARLLIETSAIPFTEVAFAAGFGSIRQFNDTVRAVFATTPTDMRARKKGGHTGHRADLSLRLPHRMPFSPQPLFHHLATTAVAGCETGDDAGLHRTLRLPHGPGIVHLTPDDGFVACRLALADVRDLQAAVARCRRLLDLDADPEAIDAALRADPALAASVHDRPGVRVPRTVVPDEMAMRVVIGQHVSRASAGAAAARLVRRCGDPLDAPVAGLTHVFPSAAQVAEADLDGLGLTTARARTLSDLARSLAGGTLDLGPGADRAEARRALAAIRGIGPWTIEVIAMRALGDPDAFPATDAGVRAGARALGIADDVIASDIIANDRAASSSRWSPWRSYATQHLWAAADTSDTTDTTDNFELGAAS